MSQASLGLDHGPPYREAPLRGTQSLVGVMAEVWRRPSLTGMEVLWRWAAGVPLLWLLYHTVSGRLTGLPLDWAALEGITVFKPLEAATTLSREAGVLAAPVVSLARWLVPAGVVWWSAASALGRTAVLRRVDGNLRISPASLAFSGALRLLALLVVLAVWLWGAGAAAHFAILGPGQRGADPNLVLYTAMVVGLTLLLFVLWSLLVWTVDLMPALSISANLPLSQALGRAVRNRDLRSKLVELNFVMGIVRVCLLVLAMVFSASPLPFQNSATQGFLNVWWAGVAAFYLLASDFFHVVRRVTCLRLLLALAPETNAVAHPAS